MGNSKINYALAGSTALLSIVSALLHLAVPTLAGAILTFLNWNVANRLREIEETRLIFEYEQRRLEQNQEERNNNE